MSDHFRHGVRCLVLTVAIAAVDCGGRALKSAGGVAPGGRGGAGGTSAGRGGAAGTGGGAGSSTGGSAGMGGVSGSGGLGLGGGSGAGGSTAACQQVATLDRSCGTNSDCVAVLHRIDCCGATVWLGVRSTESQKFAVIESMCDASYPHCGCGAGPPTTDDGSTLTPGGGVSVSCQAGTCKTFAAACGQPCSAGRGCVPCVGQDASAAFCTLRCTSDTGCTEAAYPTCQFTIGGGFCGATNLACTGR
jgi:hypothetical protein